MMAKRSSGMARTPTAEEGVDVVAGDGGGARVVIHGARADARRVAVRRDLHGGAGEVAEGADAEIREQLPLLADAGGQDAFLQQSQVLFLGLDAGGNDLADSAGLAAPRAPA